ncbi:MAG TPA: hypothetical protein VJW77_11670 [Terriglobia bacterium]|nr:hypothetical protein [Terriglobia bacterium]
MHETRDLFDFMMDRTKDVQNRTATKDYHAFGRWLAQLYFQEPKDVSTWDGAGDGKVDVVFKTEEDGELRYHVLNTKFTKKFDVIAPPNDLLPVLGPNHNMSSELCGSSGFGRARGVGGDAPRAAACAANSAGV